MAKIEIVSTSREFTNRELYRMTMDQGATSLKDCVGNLISPQGYVVYTSTKENGDSNLVLAILDDQGNVYTTISKTFIESFTNIMTFCEGDPEPVVVEVLQGTTRNGRSYINCSLR